MAQGVHGGKVVDTRAQEQELAQKVSGSVQPSVDRVVVKPASSRARCSVCNVYQDVAGQALRTLATLHSRNEQTVLAPRAALCAVRQLANP